MNYQVNPTDALRTNAKAIISALRLQSRTLTALIEQGSLSIDAAQAMVRDSTRLLGDPVNDPELASIYLQAFEDIVSDLEALRGA